MDILGKEMSNQIIAEDVGEMMLANGSTEKQMRALEGVFETLENEFLALHLQISSLRSLAHTGKDSIATFERLADTVLWSSQGLFDGIKRQRDSIAGLLGKRRIEL